ncbi:DUF4124 domain-containing protein [Vibrio sp. HDW18]|uniref:DUF4124 domain-containing protein n=1 Tax=Vibrio sp. HDW18 TaxID=2714948 RepID=UPI00140937F4|nr:DUF4124 domain-containing protein [Vibrio sp. HDW18]QIL85587.1 DUF4124 domain-containing protein [Vibrio sp. HDW18]
MLASRLWWLLICLLWVPQITAQQIYTWVDSQGVLHFSDSPQNDQAKSIHLPDYAAQAPAPSFDASQPIAENQTETKLVTTDAARKAQATKTELEPLAISLISPKHDETLRSNSGSILIRSELNRKLAIGEQLQLIMDGRPYGAPSHQAQWPLKNIDRGTHTFTIQAIENGKIIASSSIITVHLHRAMVKQE